MFIQRRTDTIRLKTGVWIRTEQKVAETGDAYWRTILARFGYLLCYRWQWFTTTLIKHRNVLLCVHMRMKIEHVISLHTIQNTVTFIHFIVYSNPNQTLRPKSHRPYAMSFPHTGTRAVTSDFTAQAHPFATAVGSRSRRHLGCACDRFVASHAQQYRRSCYTALNLFVLWFACSSRVVNGVGKYYWI